jgi:hypothetical protein
LILQNGSKKILTDNREEGGHFIAYRYNSCIPAAGFYACEIDYYEGGGAILVSDWSGKEIRLWALPVFSPDNKHFVEASFDMEAEFDPNGIRIWALDGENPQLEMTLELEK